MTNTDWIMIVSVGVLWGTAAFIAMSETALTRITPIKAVAMEEEGRRGAARLRRLVQHPERFLTPVLLLVLLCHLVAATLLGIVVDRHFGGAVLVAFTVGQVAFVFVFCESMPKTWAVQHTERAALLTAPLIAALVAFPPIRILARGLISITNVLLPGKGLKRGPFVSEEELLAMADVAADEEVIEREERTLIRQVIEFGDTVVREVMVPRTDMLAVEGHARICDAVELVINSGKSRIPVYDQGIDDVIGIVYARDLLKAEREGRGDEEVRTLGREAHFVPETKRVAELMREMQREKFHIAVVVDEYGGTAGLVTLEDLIEELVGEIVDEYDVEDAKWERLANGDYRVDARMPLDEVNELLSADLPDGDWDTVGGLLYSELGHVPTQGESVQVDGRRLTAEKVEGRRIERVRISPQLESEPQQAE
jgi:CBS domain containing-hemolysin-like protein